MDNKVVVIGGGPAGMMAALNARAHGAQVVLIEKNQRVGKKLGITGKGRGNITSAVDRDEFIASFPGNGRFLYSAFNEFSNHDLIEYFKGKGLETKVERGNRVFPQSERALDVVNLLYKNMLEVGVQILSGREVTGIWIESGRVAGVMMARDRMSADAVIIATGGLSYPVTGSTGDGYKWAQEAGHRIIDPRASLVPLVTVEGWVKELQGLSLKNVRASAWKTDGTQINEEFGEMLFTHFGVSGPIILSMSSDIGKCLAREKKTVTLTIDLKPALSEEKLDERVQRDFLKYSRRNLKNSLGELLPNKLIPVIIALSGIDKEKECSRISREERGRLVKLLKALSMTVAATRPVAEAIVTAGGVDVKEVNPRTMESRLIGGLFFAGEVLDIDGYTGGFNLQAAFSTGHAAGKYAALQNTN
ncbi:nad(fad)-utilizing dehydrogenase [hydrocarbon metagenome]|uniref:Nad(Fad)-utilizing dehydrogenase n=1 Tax=hydrocarbon metagenome TaxID=938273 RepID=A0A0W8E3N7_9ZZZZ